MKQPSQIDGAALGAAIQRAVRRPAGGEADADDEHRRAERHRGRADGDRSLIECARTSHSAPGRGRTALHHKRDRRYQHHPADGTASATWLDLKPSASQVSMSPAEWPWAQQEIARCRLPYHVGQHDGGYGYRLGDVWSETFRHMMPPFPPPRPPRAVSTSKAAMRRSSTRLPGWPGTWNMPKGGDRLRYRGGLRPLTGGRPSRDLTDTGTHDGHDTTTPRQCNRRGGSLVQTCQEQSGAGIERWLSECKEWCRSRSTATAPPRLLPGRRPRLAGAYQRLTACRDEGRPLRSETLAARRPGASRDASQGAHGDPCCTANPG